MIWTEKRKNELRKEENRVIKSIKVMLCPNKKQFTKLFQYAGAARFAYNWALEKEMDCLRKQKRLLSDTELRKEFTQLKKQEE